MNPIHPTTIEAGKIALVYEPGHKITPVTLVAQNHRVYFALINGLETIILELLPISHHQPDELLVGLIVVLVHLLCRSIHS